MEKLIGTIAERNGYEQVRVFTTEYYGDTYLNIRVYVLVHNEWHPTEKGITVPIDDAGDLVNLILEALATTVNEILEGEQPEMAANAN